MVLDTQLISSCIGGSHTLLTGSQVSDMLVQNKGRLSGRSTHAPPFGESRDAARIDNALRNTRSLSDKVNLSHYFKTLSQSRITAA